MKTREIRHSVERDPFNGVSLHYNKGTISLLAGSRDKLIIRRVGDNIAVLSYDNSLPYVGLDLFDYYDGSLESEIFLQESQVYELIPKYDDIQDYTVMQILLTYLYNNF